MTEKSNIEELLEMCFYGHLDQVDRLLKEGVDIDGIGENGMTPLHAAFYGDNYDIIKFLIENNADVNQGNCTILHEAIDYSIDRMVQKRLEAPDSETLKLIEFLIEHGADLNKLDDKKRTPLDLIKFYSNDLETFKKIKGFFRSFIKDIDSKIRY